MGNCLKTQLKESVNNSNLPIFGVIRFDKYYVQSTFNINYYVRVVPTADNVLVAKLKDGAQFLDNSGNPIGNTFTIPSHGAYLHLPLSACQMYLEKKYVKDIETSITVLNGSKIYLSDLSYAQSLESINGILSGNIKNLASCPVLKDFKSGVGSTINGSIVDAFGNLTQLTKIYINSPQTKDINGSIEGFVAAQRLAGRTIVESESPLTINITGTYITFNGSSASTATDTPLYWDANTITYGNTTINA